MNLLTSNNPDFAEKLMSTFFVGTSMSDAEEKECEKIWKECNNNRSEVLKRVVDICGNVDSPQTRYLKAIAWSFNSTKYAQERIEAINKYLSNKLYFDAFKNNVITLDYGIKKGEKFHRAIFFEYLATAYNSIKDYKECEATYIKIIKLDTDIPNGYMLLADFYKRHGNLDLAIDTLKNAKKTLKYIFNKEFKNNINIKLKEYENLKNGIRKHKFSMFDTYPNTWINNTYRKDLEEAHLKLREQYKNVFERHRLLIGSIENIEFDSKNSGKDYYENEEYEKYCIDDINLYTSIKEFYYKLNQLGFNYKIEYQDNGKNDYVSFKKLIKYYVKRKEYRNAIDICEKAKNVGINQFSPSSTMDDEIYNISKRIREVK